MIIYAPDADRDVTRLHAWFLEYSGVAAEAFMTRLALAERRIGERPRTYRLLNYRIEPAQIVVLRVWHGRQNRPE